MARRIAQSVRSEISGTSWRGGTSSLRQDIVGLDIAVNNSLLMSAVQPLCHFGDDANRFRFRHPAVPLDFLPERLSFHELHDEVRRTAGIGIVERANDVGMIETAG